MKYLRYTLLLLLLSGGILRAQEPVVGSTETTASATKKQPISVIFNVRGDWEHDIQALDDTTVYNTRFSLCYLNFVLNGKFTDKLSYNVRFRLNRLRHWDDILDAFDNLNLAYEITPQWKVSAGKQMVYIGGYEYDYNPLDVYYWSLANYFVNCYEVGVLGQYTTPDGKHSIIAQICNSPFQDRSHHFDGKLAYNLMWYGDFGFYKPIWSLNFMAYDWEDAAAGSGAAVRRKQKFTNHLVLGNRFDFGPARIELDYHNRYFFGQGSFFEDFSLIGKLNVNIKDRVNVMVKGGVDYNGTGYNDDPWVVAEQRYLQMGSPADVAKHLSGYIGAGVEVFPLPSKSRDLRLHAYWMMDNRSGSFDRHYAALGITWWFRAFER